MQRHSESIASVDQSKFWLDEKRTLPIDSRVHAVTRTAFALLLALLALWVASDFLSALAWATLIAVTVWPVYSRFASVVSGGRSRTLASLVFTILIGLVLLVPIILTVHQIAQGSDAFVGWLHQLREGGGISAPSWVKRLPVAGEYLDRWWQSNLSDPLSAFEWLRGVNMEGITVWTSALGGALLHRLFLFLITLVVLFVVLRDGAWLCDRVLATMDVLFGHSDERLAGKVADAVRGIVNGTVVVAIGKGGVIGIAYVLAGFSRPLFFTVLTIALAMIPFGVWVALTIASLMLLAQGGGLLLAIGLFGFGVIAILIADNFVQPALIAGATRLPFLLALIGILGGLQSFGLLGLFLGPMIMAAVLAVWREWVGDEG
jgi:predicted PurR-regulated permease PerM